MSQAYYDFYWKGRLDVLLELKEFMLQSEDLNVLAIAHFLDEKLDKADSMSKGGEVG